MKLHKPEAGTSDSALYLEGECDKGFPMEIFREEAWTLQRMLNFGPQRPHKIHWTARYRGNSRTFRRLKDAKIWLQQKEAEAC